MFFAHGTAGSFRENITHAEQGWANPGRINELEVPDPSGGRKQGPALPRCFQPALFSSSRLIYAHGRDACSPLLWCTDPQTPAMHPGWQRCRSPWEDGESVLVPGTGWTQGGCAGAKCPGKTQPSPIRVQAATGEIPLKWAKNKEEKPFHSRAGKPWAREAAAISPIFPWAPPTPIAPQSLIALGEPKGKE